MDDTSPLPGRGIKPLTSLLAHPLLALAVAVLVLIVGAPLAWKKSVPSYSADATIQVAPRYMRNLRDDQELEFQSNTQYRQFVEHMRRSVGRHDVLRDALARLGERRDFWQRPDETERRAIDRLRAALQVSSVPDTYLLRLSLKGDEPEGLAEIVNAVSTTFVERMKSEQIYGADERTRQLREREQELLTRIADLGAQRASIAQQLSLTTFNEGTPNPYDGVVADLRRRLADAQQRRLEAEAALVAFRTRGDTTMASRSVQDAVLNDPGLNTLKGALSTRRATLLTQKSGLRADHPGAAAAERELAEIERELGQQSDQIGDAVRSNLLGRLQGTAEQARSVETGLLQQLQALEDQASTYAQRFQNAMTLTADLSQARSELDKVRERVNHMEVESGSLGFLRIVSAALTPDLPVGPGRRRMLLMVLIAAAGAGLAAPVLRDLLDRRVHTVNDAQRLLGIAPAGWQVERQDAASHLFGDEQLRRIAAALLRSRDARGRRAFGFTACKPGAGVTSLVLELGGMLQALGCRVLVVEAGGRDPRLGDDRPGLDALLRGEADADAVVRPGTDARPATVAACLGAEPVPLQRLDRLEAALQHWSQGHDFVLVDMPALLTSADAELLVRALGQVLLVVEAGATTRGELTRARRLLQVIDPQAVGLVVNRVRPFDAGGYLRDLMLETLGRRRLDAVLTVPRWRLWLATGAPWKTFTPPSMAPRRSGP